MNRVLTVPALAFVMLLPASVLSAGSPIMHATYHVDANEDILSEHSLLRSSFTSDMELLNWDERLPDDVEPLFSPGSDAAVVSGSPWDFSVDVAPSGLSADQAARTHQADFTALVGMRRFKDLISVDDDQLSSGTQYGFRVSTEIGRQNDLSGYELVGLLIAGDHSQKVGRPEYRIPDLQYASQLASGELNYWRGQHRGGYFRRQLIGLRMVAQHDQFDATHFFAVSSISIYDGSGTGSEVDNVRTFVDMFPFSQEYWHYLLAPQVGYEGGYSAGRTTFSGGLRAAIGGDMAELSTTRTTDPIIRANSLSPGQTRPPSHSTITTVERDFSVRSLLEYQCKASFAVRPSTHLTAGVYGISLVRFDEPWAAVTGGDAGLMHYLMFQAGLQHQW